MPEVRRARLFRALAIIVSAVALATAGCAPTDVSTPASNEPVATVVLSPVADNLLVGDSQQMIALLKDSKDRRLTGREVSWASADPAIAEVSSTGIVSGRAPGAAHIVATSESKSATSVITVYATRQNTAECDSPRPAWLWCDDFEQDRLGSYFEYESRGGSFERVAGVGYGGSSGMRARFSERGQVEAGFLHLAFGKTPSSYFRPVDGGTIRYQEIYWRHFVKLQIGWVGGGGNKLSRAQTIASTNWAQVMMAHVWSGIMSEGEPYRLGIVPATTVDSSGSRVLGTSYNDFPHFRWLGKVWSRTPIFDRTHVGKWYCIEARARLDDPGRSNGVFELWINGGLEASIGGLSWRGRYSEYGINTVFLENYWNDGAPQAQERYFDNFIVSTQRIGC